MRPILCKILIPIPGTLVSRFWTDSDSIADPCNVVHCSVIIGLHAVHCTTPTMTLECTTLNKKSTLCISLKKWSLEQGPQAAALWHNFVEEMKMHALCSNFDGSVPLKGLSRSHQTIWRLLLMGPTNILHQYCLNETWCFWEMDLKTWQITRH